MVTVKISGFDQIAAHAEKMASILQLWNEKATVENLKDFKEKSRNRAPYKTGALRRSIDYRITQVTNTSVSGKIGSDLPYALITELGGTIPAHVVRAKNRKVLYSKKTNTFFGKEVLIPAQHRTAKPYLFPVLIENIEVFLNRYKQAFDAASKEIGK